jgi:DNA-binding transcriptional ArsR family regulator
MESVIPDRLAALGHPQRLAILRLLMRRFPDRLPAGDISRALGLKGSTLSNYLSHLMQVGLVTQERSGTSLLYAPDMDAMRGTVGYLFNDCCRGRPDLCPPAMTSPAPGATAMTNESISASCSSAQAIPRARFLPKRFCAISAVIGSMSIPPERNLGPN